MNPILERLARQAGINEVVDLRRHDVEPVLQQFAAFVAERCAAIAQSVVLARAADPCKDTPQETGAHVSEAIRLAFRVPKSARDTAHT
jgi:hypothetical protein